MPLADHARRAVCAVAAGPLFTGVIGGVERWSRWRPEVLNVLTYHRVGTSEGSPDLYPGLISADPDQFERQMALVADHYRPVSIHDVVAACTGDGPGLQPRSVLITFDDAYRDFAVHAWPILRSRGLPATMFVPTAFPGAPDRAFWWDRLHAAIARAPADAHLEVARGRRLPLRGQQERSAAYREVRELIKGLPHQVAMDRLDDVLGELAAPQTGAVLSWDELRHLRSEGLALAPHSRTHALLNRVPSEQLDDEVSGSVADLEGEVGPCPAVFAYPSGAHDADAVAAVRRAGLVLAFTTRRGGNDLRRADLLRLRRVNVGRRSSPGLLRAQMLPALAAPR